MQGRARLADIDAALARLRAQHDIAMSAFKFDEANALLRDIAALDEERQALAASQPPVAAPPPKSAIPVLLTPRQAKRVRRPR
jgi:hypothetical protein